MYFIRAVIRRKLQVSSGWTWTLTFKDKWFVVDLINRSKSSVKTVTQVPGSCCCCWSTQNEKLTTCSIFLWGVISGDLSFVRNKLIYASAFRLTAFLTTYMLITFKYLGNTWPGNWWAWHFSSGLQQRRSIDFSHTENQPPSPNRLSRLSVVGNTKLSFIFDIDKAADSSPVSESLLLNGTYA